MRGYTTAIALGISAIALVALGVVVEQSKNEQLLGNAAATWIPTATMLKPFSASYGLLVQGLATSTTGCLAVKSNGYIFASGSACGTGVGAASAFEIATSSSIAISELAYFTKTTGRTTIAGTATSSLTASSPLALSQPISIIGASASSLTLDTSGTWSGNSGTATALAADGANCSAGSAAGGVSTLGAAQDCTDYWTEAENTSAGYVASTRTLTVAGTANQLTSSAGAQDLSANRTWTLSFPNQLIFPANASTTLKFSVLGAGTSTDLQGNTEVWGMLGVGRTATTTIRGDNATSTFASGILGTALEVTGNTKLGGNITFNGVTSATWAGFCATITGSSALCDGNDATGAGGGDWPFTPATHWGQAVQSTTTALHLLASPFSLFASSTAQLQNASTTDGFTSGGNTWLTTITSAMLITGADGLVAEYTGIDCTNQFVRDVSALGAGTCATVGADDVSLANLTATDTTLTFSGTYNGSTARTIGLNLGNANTWTALQTFSANASTTRLSVTAAGTSTTMIGNSEVFGMFGVGATATTTIRGDNATSTFAGGGFFNSLRSTLAPTFDSLTSAILITGTGGGLAEYTGTTCTNQFVRSLDALGVATCASINNGDWSGTDLSVANGGTGLSTFGGTNTVLYTTTADNLASESAFTYVSTNSQDLLTVSNASTTAVSVGNFLKVPNLAALGATVAGMFGTDTTSEQLRWHAGATYGEQVALRSYEPTLIVASTTPDHSFTDYRTGTTTLKIGNKLRAMTATNIYCISTNNTLLVDLGDGAATSTANFVCSPTGTTQTLSSSNTFTTREGIYLGIGSATTTDPNSVTVTITYKETVD